MKTAQRVFYLRNYVFTILLFLIKIIYVVSDHNHNSLLCSEKDLCNSQLGKFGILLTWGNHKTPSKDQLPVFSPTNCEEPWTAVLHPQLHQQDSTVFQPRRIAFNPGLWSQNCYLRSPILNFKSTMDNVHWTLMLHLRASLCSMCRPLVVQVVQDLLNASHPQGGAIGRWHNWWGADGVGNITMSNEHDHMSLSITITIIIVIRFLYHDLDIIVIF